VPGLFDTDQIAGMFGMFGGWPEPPDSVPLHILGLDEKPAGQAAIRSAFRARVLHFHPDVIAYTDPGLTLAAEALAAGTPQVQELVWARDVLLRKTPPPVTGGISSSEQPRQPSHRRRVCKVCDSTRLRHDGRPWDVLNSAFGRRLRWIGYCPPCAGDAENTRTRQRRAAARANRICQSCDKPFTPPRSDAQYCGHACRQRAYRSRAGAPDAA